MGMTASDYAQDRVRTIPFNDLFAEFRERFSTGREIEAKMNEAYSDGDVCLTYAYASELGVIQIQLQILESEVERRDAEEPPLSPEESAEAENVLLEEMLKRVFTSY